ncbi:hypothetical protein TWF694_003322 [Orbilia ellipsospora]|uniref:Uncharacterized protein n=1 Tax=Orbilia ellipsospora TaxID=2528407 RepID=A0AAV9X158_9PEZI
MQQQQEQDAGHESRPGLSESRRALDDDDNASVYTVLPSYEALPPQPPSFAEASESTANAPVPPPLQSKANQGTLKGMKAKLKELQKQSEAHRQERHTLTTEEAGRMAGSQNETEEDGGKTAGWYDIVRVML